MYTEEITRVIDGVHDLVELYGDEGLKNDTKQIEMLSNIYSELKKIGINLSDKIVRQNEPTLQYNPTECAWLSTTTRPRLSDFMEKDVKKLYTVPSKYNSKLEQFELEEQSKKKN